MTLIVADELDVRGRGEVSSEHVVANFNVRGNRNEVTLRWMLFYIKISYKLEHDFRIEKKSRRFGKIHFRIFNRMGVVRECTRIFIYLESPGRKKN